MRKLVGERGASREKKPINLESFIKHVILVSVVFLQALCNGGVKTCAFIGMWQLQSSDCHAFTALW